MLDNYIFREALLTVLQTYIDITRRDCYYTPAIHHFPRLFNFFLNKCPFHIQRPLNATTGKNTQRTAFAAGGLDATGP